MRSEVKWQCLMFLLSKDKIIWTKAGLVHLGTGHVLRDHQGARDFHHSSSIAKVCRVSFQIMWHGQIEFHPSLTWTSPSPWEYAGHIDAKRGIQMICNDTGVLELYLYRSFSIGRYTYASRTERFAGPQVSPCSNSCCTVNGGVCSWRYEILLFSFSMVQFLDFLPRQAPLDWHKLTVFSTWNVCSEDFVQTRVIIPTQLRIHSPFQLLGVNVLSLGNCASLRWKQYETVAKPCLRWNRCSMIFIRCLNSKMSDTTHIRILSLYTCLSIHIRIWKAWWLCTSKWSALWWCIMRRLSSKGDTNGDLNNGTPLPVHKSSPVAIAKLKGSVGLNDPGQRELLKLCLSLTLAWSMVHGPSWSNSCSFTLLHAPSCSFMVLRGPSCAKQDVWKSTAARNFVPVKQTRHPGSRNRRHSFHTRCPAQAWHSFPETHG